MKRIELSQKTIILKAGTKDAVISMKEWLLGILESNKKYGQGDKNPMLGRRIKDAFINKELGDSFELDHTCYMSLRSALATAEIVPSVAIECAEFYEAVKNAEDVKQTGE